MSLVLNMVGGSGGGGLPENAAVLAVIVTLGCDVTISQNGVAKTIESNKAHILDTDNSYAAYLFSIRPNQFGTWTITATRGNYSQTRTITIDSAEYYEIQFRVNLPNEYQEVEYIKSSGTQALKTSFIVPTQFGFEVDGAFTLGTSQGYTNIFGGALPSGTSGIYFMSYGPRFFRSYEGTANAINFSGDNSRHTYYYKFNGTNYSYGKDNTQISTATVQPTVDSQMAIFGYCEPSGTVRSSERASGSLYSLKFYSGNDKVANFVPCYRKSDSVAGMYDSVSNAFYSNVGTGSFTVGADV